MSELSHLILPLGFRYGATTAGLKASGRADFAVIVADEAANAAAVFTANRVSAAPLAIDKEHLSATGGKVRVVAINAGNANCAAGPAGYDAARATCNAVAEVFGCSPEQVFPSSTGIIGVPLPAEKLIAVLPSLAASIGRESDHFAQAAQAILTTDLVEKTAFARVNISASQVISASASDPFSARASDPESRAVSQADGTSDAEETPDGAAAGSSQEVRIAAFGKGSGMIHPRLVPHATMLVYILTDARIEPAELRVLLSDAVNLSFNRISVDGDTSTNDTVLLLASGASGVAVDSINREFASALNQVCISLARQIVADGEGVTHVVELHIEGAATDADALTVAKAIAHSPLVKTAWAGSDPNWGRLMAAVGYSGVHIDPERIDISFGDLPICRNGGRAPEFDIAAAHAYVSQPEFSVTIRLNQGVGGCVFWTTDLTAQYVRINADYST